MMDYVAEFYKVYFRELIKDLMERYPNFTKETSEEEIEFISGRLKDDGLYSLLEGCLTRRNFNTWCYGIFPMLREEKEDKKGKENKKKKRNKKEKDENRHKACNFVQEVDFSDIRKRPDNKKDIVWILQGSQVRYPAKSAKYDADFPRDGSSHRQFQQLLEQIGFTEREKQLFNYNDAYYYFNGLVDNGDYIYSQEDKADKSVFLNSLQKSDLSVMYNELLDMLKLCYEEKDSKSLRKMDAWEAIKVAEYLSDLIPIIDRNSKLKDEERLLDERIAVRLAVLKKFLFDKDNNERSSEKLKKVLVKYFEDRILVSALVGEMSNKEKFTDEQILIMTEEYLDRLREDMEEMKKGVSLYHYNDLLRKLRDAPDPNQVCLDLWEDAKNEGAENE